MRAYANRAMLLASICVPTTLLALALAAYVRLQPPTVIRVDATGTAVAVDGKPAQKSLTFVSQGAGAEPTDFEKTAFGAGALRNERQRLLPRLSVYTSEDHTSELH